MERIQVVRESMRGAMADGGKSGILLSVQSTPMALSWTNRSMAYVVWARGAENQMRKEKMSQEEGKLTDLSRILQGCLSGTVLVGLQMP